jgi:tetratricopeptide (TPR) repeat protein
MKKILGFVIAVLILTSCGNSDGTKKKLNNFNNNEISKTEVLNVIKGLEGEVYGVSPDKVNKSKALLLAKYYVNYSSYGDSLAPQYLYKASGIYMNSDNPKKALSALNEIIRKYPDFDKLENCYFLRGFIFDDQLKKYDSAKNAYNEYLKKYPNGDFADDSKVLIENLGKSEEEVFEKLEEK